jgi:alpha-glucosidase
MLSNWLDTIHHDGSGKYVSHLYPKVGDTVRLRLRVRADAPIRRVFVRTSADGWQVFTLMTQGPLQRPVRWFEAELPITRPLTLYRFVVEAQDGVWSYTAAGVTPHSPLDSSDFRIVADRDGGAPDWLRSSVFYRVFVDRFANGDPSTDPRPEEYDRPGYPFREFEYEGHRPRTFPWGAQPASDQIFPLVFYGGDLPGVVQKLDHLQELGVNALALSPIFTSPSNHRYDAASYEEVDPRVGGNEALTRLREALTARQMRYVIEMDCSQVSYAHPWFQAAQRDREAPEADFFSLDQEGEFSRWLGLGCLRKLNHRSPGLVRRMFTDRDSVLRRWLAPPYAADGWTLHLPHADREGNVGEVGRVARRAVRAGSADACLLSSSFVDSTSRLQGDELDGLADFNAFTFPLWHWLRGYREEGGRGLKKAIAVPGTWSTAALETAWRTGRAAIPWSTTLHQVVMVDGHDLPRIQSVVGGNDALHRLAAVLQFTYPGVPAVYYGDEIGLEDVPRLSQRGCMFWDQRRWNRKLFAFYKELIALRLSSPVLQEGGFQVLAMEADTLVYQREGATERVVVVAHRGARPRPEGPVVVEHGGVPDGMSFTERFSGQEAVVKNGSLQLPELPQGATIWIAEEPGPATARGRPRRKRRAGHPSPRDARRCPSCGRQDGSRLESRLTSGDSQEERRWVCLWCGAIWKRPD